MDCAQKAAKFGLEADPELSRNERSSHFSMLAEVTGFLVRAIGSGLMGCVIPAAAILSWLQKTQRIT
jgi:hypothetical protein